MSPLHPERPVSGELTGEINAINRAFLALLNDPQVAACAPLLGLQAGVLTRLHDLDTERLDALARAPMLLAGFGFLPGAANGAARSMCQVADNAVPDEWQQAALRFANRLLTLLWRYSREPDGITGFCMGIDRTSRDWLMALSFDQLCEQADDVCASLQARHADHPACWPDLVRSACAGPPEKLTAAQLSLIPLTITANHISKV